MLKKHALTIGVTIGLLIAAYKFIPFDMLVDIKEQPDGLTISRKASDADFKQSGATVIELFTSQSCYSCPPAEAFLRELGARQDVITLEYHVDYWDDLVYGSAGKWKDVFSTPESTMRQADYNQAIRQSSQAFTPQMIIDGKYQEVGSRRDKINSLIQMAQKNRQKSDIQIIAKMTGTRDQVHISTSTTAPDVDLNLLLVRLKKRHVTDVRAGENKDKTLASYNIVINWLELREWQKQKDFKKQLQTPLAKDETCALLLYQKKTMHISSATFCQNDSPSVIE